MYVDTRHDETACDRKLGAIIYKYTSLSFLCSFDGQSGRGVACDRPALQIVARDSIDSPLQQFHSYLELCTIVEPINVPHFCMHLLLF